MFANIENVLCLKHNEKIILVEIDDRVPPENSLHCNKCIAENNQLLKSAISAEKVQEFIREIIMQQRAIQEERISKQLNKIKSFKQNLIEIKQQFFNAIEKIVALAEHWEKDLTGTTKVYETINLFQGLDLIRKGPDQSDLQKPINTNHLLKICSAFKGLLAIVAEKINECQKFFSETSQTENKRMSFRMINQIKQVEPCFALSFSGNQLITGSERNIKVWEFQGGQMKLQQELKGLGNRISCLQFSRKYKWFVSGDGGGNITGWIQRENQQWSSILAMKKHSSCINCILLTRNEDTLFTCGEEKTILIWNVMTGTNQIVFAYALQEKHNAGVFGLSLNQSESELVSCGADKQIILWVKDGKWTFKCSLGFKKALTRICYFHDNFILAQQGGEGYSNLLVIDEQIKQGEELRFNVANEKNDYILFPTIYNKRRGIIIQKSNQYVYLIKKEKNGQLLLETPPINCETKEIYGALSDNGEHLIIWNSKAKEFQVFEIIYN